MIIKPQINFVKIRVNVINISFLHSFNQKKCNHKRLHILLFRSYLRTDMSQRKRYFSSNVSLKVIGSGSALGCTSLFLSTDHNQYLFNCGEGTQRLMNEYKCKITKLKNVFITSSTWKNTGGLPGILLTLLSTQEKGHCVQDTIDNFKIYAPHGVKEMVHVLRNTLFMSRMKFSVEECDVITNYEDNILKVSCIPIYVNVKNDADKCVPEMTANNDIDDDNFNVNRKRKHSGNRIDKKIKSSKKSNTFVLSYICKLQDKLGALCMETCLAKGLKAGPILGILKSGEDVTLEDGTIVKSKDVCRPASKGPTFLIVECPNENYLESFINHSAFTKHQRSASNEDDKPYLIVHFTPQNIMDHPKYKDWMNKFDSNTYHIIINETNACMGSEAVHKQQVMLNCINPKIFPSLESKCFQDESNTTWRNETMDNIQRIYYAKSLQTITLRPTIKFSSESTISINRDNYLKEFYELPGIADTLKEVECNITNEMKSLLDVQEYPEINMLGTGSSVPSKIRNTSAILVRIDEDSSILLDCSEGTLCQLARLYGPSELNRILASIKAIFISHFHADHHLGLISILQARAAITKDRTFLLLPNNLVQWVQGFHEHMEPIEDYYKLLKNYDILLGNHKLPLNVEMELYEKLNVKEINTVTVLHCISSFAISLETKNAKKIAYSGDTMPCSNMVKLGQNCDLLIHEATLDDDSTAEEKTKRHSSIKDAIEIGEKMKARFILLTHFSQRYAKIPIIPNSSELSKIAIAYDHMRFNLPQVKILPYLIPCLQNLFHKYMIQYTKRIEYKKAKRKRGNM